MLRHTLLTLALFLLFPVLLFAAEESSYYALTKQNGLSSNNVLQMTQLSDGRMVVVTDIAIDIYDGMRFTSVAIDTARWTALPAYNGATHIFADQHDRLWQKQWGRLYCFNLRTMQQEVEQGWNFDDFFIDQEGQTWILKGQQLVNQTSKKVLQLPQETGALQDVVASGETIYTFFDSGQLAAFQSDGKLLFVSQAYDEEESMKYKWTSLVVTGPDKHLYQVRMGSGGSILLAFDTDERQWRQILTSHRPMHTLTLTPTGILYLTTPDGYLRINPKTGAQDTFNELRLPDGSVLSTGVNTVCLDREGGIWLGTYNSGVLYTSPLSGLFDTQPLNIDVYPILTAIYLQGLPLQVGTEYDGRTLLDVTPPYTQQLTFSHRQNSLAFQFSTMNYVRPRSTCYRYRFSGDGNQWHTLSADSLGRLVDDKGIFYLPLVGLSPGEYTLEVMASTNPEQWNKADIRRIYFTIQHPWWQTPFAYILYLFIAATVVALAFYFYRRRLQRRNREDMLLLRIQNLVEQVNQYQNSEAMVVLGPEPDNAQDADLPEPTTQEKEFMARATQLVEQHLATPQYGVEQLAADLCMERTGLYKKLTTLMQQSPVVFIRSIRLHRAADLILQGKDSISEVAEHTGFNSTSYFSKCFQKEFGCKPSEYAEQKKGTSINSPFIPPEEKTPMKP